MPGVQDSDHATKPLTVLARYKVFPGKEPLFAAWMRGITEACRRYEGYLGTEVIRARDAGGGEHVCIFRFDRYDHLEAWMQSEERRSWVNQASDFASAPVIIEPYQSLEFWFSHPAQRKEAMASRPSRSKMALVTFGAIFPLVHFIPPTLARGLTVSPLVHQAISTGIIVVLMTWAVMPLAVRVLGPWLHRTAKGSQ